MRTYDHDFPFDASGGTFSPVGPIARGALVPEEGDRSDCCPSCHRWLLVAPDGCHMTLMAREGDEDPLFADPRHGYPEEILFEKDASATCRCGASLSDVTALAAA